MPEVIEIDVMSKVAYQGQKLGRNSMRAFWKYMYVFWRDRIIINIYEYLNLKIYTCCLIILSIHEHHEKNIFRLISKYGQT